MLEKYPGLRKLIASLIIWAVPVFCLFMSIVQRWRTGWYMRKKYPEKWKSMGGGRLSVDYAQFGAFLFDGDDFMQDEQLRRMKLSIVLLLILSFLSTVMAFVFNFLSDRYFGQWFGK